MAEKVSSLIQTICRKTFLFFGMGYSFRFVPLQCLFLFRNGTIVLFLFSVLFVSQLVEWALNKQTTLILTTNRSILVMELTQIIQTMELFSINLIGPPQLNELTQYSVALSVYVYVSAASVIRDIWLVREKLILAKDYVPLSVSFVIVSQLNRHTFIQQSLSNVSFAAGFWWRLICLKTLKWTLVNRSIKASLGENGTM